MKADQMMEALLRSRGPMMGALFRSRLNSAQIRVIVAACGMEIKFGCGYTGRNKCKYGKPGGNSNT